MSRVKIEDGTQWPDPTCERFGDVAWGLRYGKELTTLEMYYAAEIIEAYGSLITHPAFNLKKVQAKISGIRKAIKH